jgi:hypothetical protein
MRTRFVWRERSAGRDETTRRSRADINPPDVEAAPPGLDEQPPGAHPDLQRRPARRGHPLHVELVVDPVAHLRVDDIVEAGDEVGIGLAHDLTSALLRGSVVPPLFSLPPHLRHRSGSAW